MIERALETLTIEYLDYAGLVYDIQVLDDQSYVAGGLVAHNCTMLPIVPGFAPIKTKTGQEWFSEQPESVQREMMGPGKFKAWKEGRFTFGQLVTVKPNKTWGPSARVTSLKDLLQGRGGYTPRPPAPKPAFPSLPLAPAGQPALPALDHSALEAVDLHKVGPNWGAQAADWKKQSYGGIIFDDQGRVLLRKPTGNFDGYAWTFPKGRLDSAGEHPVQAALREVEQESGHAGAILGLVPGQYQAGKGSTLNNFFLMKSAGFDKSKMDDETEDLVWATPDEAKKLIKQGANKAGVKRDLAVLDAATTAYDDLATGKATNDYLFAKPKTPKPAVITHFNDALLDDFKKKFPGAAMNDVAAKLKKDGTGVAILDGTTGKPKTVMSWDQSADNYVTVTGLAADGLPSLKTALINAGKAAAKQGKGIIIPTNPAIYPALKGLGMEGGGPGKPAPAGTYYLDPAWMKDWTKAPTKFKAPAAAPLPPPPADFSRGIYAPDTKLPGLMDHVKNSISDPLALKGIEAGLEKIKAGHANFAYGKGADFAGLITYEDQGSIIKVTSAGFMDFDANLAGLKDVVKVAKQKGKDFVTFAPNGPVLEQYKAWGFEVQAAYSNGASLSLKKANFDTWLKDPAAYGAGKPVTAAAPAPPPAAPKTAYTPPPTFRATPRPRQFEPVPTPVPLPEPPGFPDEPEGLRPVRRLGGSTGAELVEDGQGRRFVRKRGSSPEHIVEECYADAAYQAAGASVPRFRLYQTANGPIKLAEYVEGDSLKDVLAQGGARAKKARKNVQALFAADALFSNRDVVGLDYDNILVDKKGNAWRIDNGGSFRFRAQGQRKADWDDYATDLWSMRDKAVNSQTADLFGDVDFYAISDQILALQQRRQAVLAAVPPDIQDNLARRLDNAVDLARTGKDFEADKYLVKYADDFSKDRMEIRRAGITQRLSTALDARPTGADPRGRAYRDVTPVDESGREFDSLRGRDSVVKDFAGLVNKMGGKYSIVSKWAASQGGNSWNDEPMAFRYWLIKNAIGSKKPEEEFFWYKGYDKAKRAYEREVTRHGEEVYAKTMRAYQALTYEVVSQVDFPNRDANNRTVKLYRTENRDVMRMNGLKPGDKNVVIKRGAIESTSIFQPVTVFGSELTEQDVPWHRIIGVYFLEREPGANYGPFLGDHENEFVAMLKDIPFDYLPSY